MPIVRVFGAQKLIISEKSYGQTIQKEMGIRLRRLGSVTHQEVNLVRVELFPGYWEQWHILSG